MAKCKKDCAMKCCKKTWLSALEGKKTYLIATAGIVLWLGTVAGVWSMEQIQELYVLLGSLGVASLRHGMPKK